MWTESAWIGMVVSETVIGDSYMQQIADRDLCSL